MRVRYTLRDRELLRKIMEHPGRGTPHSTRTLAAEVGCHHSQIGRLLDGAQETCDMDIAHNITEAVGVAVLVLFVPPTSPRRTESATDQYPPR